MKKHGKNKLKKIAIPLENPGLICCDDSTWPRCPVLGDTWWDASSSWQTQKRNYTLHVPALWTYRAIYKNLHTCPADLPPLHIHMCCYSFWGGQGARRSEVKIQLCKKLYKRTVNLGSRLHRIRTSKSCWLWLLKSPAELLTGHPVRNERSPPQLLGSILNLLSAASRGAGDFPLAAEGIKNGCHFCFLQ